jgi:hypothetical protein
MPSLVVRTRGLARSAWLGAALFFVLFYLYVWLRVNPGLLYFWPSPIFPTFSVGSAFLRGILVYPGGPVEYAAAFLSQLYYRPWAGALVVTTVAALMWASARLVVTAAVGSSIKRLHFVPAVLFLVLCSRYDHPLALGSAFLVAMLGACLYVRARRLGPWVGFVGFLVLYGLVYYAAGGASLLYALLCCLIELTASGSAVRASACLVAGAILPSFAWLAVFDVSLAEAYWRLVPFYHGTRVLNEVVGLCLYLCLPLVAVVAVLWRRLAARAPGSAQGTASGLLAWLGGQAASPVFKRAWTPAALFAIAAIAVWLSLDLRLKGYLELERCAGLGMWPQLLQRARAIPRRRYDLLICYDVNRALYHTGRLPDEMFSYPQHPSGLLIAPATMAGAFRAQEMGSPSYALMKFSDILYELGCVNDSEHMAHEVFGNIGRRPMVLKRLALLNVVKGQTEAARGYLWALDKDVIYGPWARGCLGRLDADPLLSADEELRRIRSSMPVKDEVKDIPVEVLLRDCLEANNRNRMAFEYLMGYLLLNRQLGAVVDNIGRLSDLGYMSVPRSYEEAALIHGFETRSEVDLHGRSISRETQERFRAFREALSRYRDNPAGARAALLKDYGDSYFYYWAFGPSGAGT